MASDMNRREFLGSAAAAAATFTIVPRRVLGGAGFVAPSDKITLACVGFGTQAIREIGGILASPDVEVVAVCDVDRDGAGYLEWGKNQIRDGIRRMLDNPAWREGVSDVPGGLNVGKEIVDTFYAKWRGGEPRKGCAAYVDFRELLEKEKDVTAVKVMTPDHTHAAISIAALKKGMNVIVHKPLANRVMEARAVIEAARAAKRATHFLPASEGAGQKQALEMIRNGAIGHLREIHNWSVRPMWPQFADDSRRHAAGAARLRLDAVAGPVARPTLSPGLHPHELPQLVRVRRRVDRRHGALQPVADLPGARTRRADERRVDAHARVRGEGRHLRADQERLLLPDGLHDPDEVRLERPTGPPWTSSGTTAASSPRCPRS